MKPVSKKQVLEHCIALLDQRVAEAQEAMDRFQKAANDETKSTAGDKHETSRAMMQADREKVAVQLANLLKFKPILHRINPETSSAKIAMGSLVVTDHGQFFLSVPLGNLNMNNSRIMAISVASPIGKLMLGKRVNDTFSFNLKTYQIQEVL